MKKLTLWFLNQFFKNQPKKLNRLGVKMVDGGGVDGGDGGSGNSSGGHATPPQSICGS